VRLYQKSNRLKKNLIKPIIVTKTIENIMNNIGSKLSYSDKNSLKSELQTKLNSFSFETLTESNNTVNNAIQDIVKKYGNYFQ